jgi:hypothetical protein
MRGNHIVLGVICSAAAACGGGGGGGGDGESLRVSGVVRDFQSGDPIAGSISVSTQGLEPAPTVTVGGSEYSLEGVTSDSIFYVLAGAPPTHRSTYGAAVEVDDEDLADIDVRVVAEAYLASLADAFGIAPSAANGVLFAQAVDDGGDAKAGISEDAFVPPDGALGPYFLDADLEAAPLATETSASGWVVFFEVDPGLVGLTAGPSSGYTMDMALSPVAPAVATVAVVHVLDGAAVLPENVSFANDVVAIFETRGCQNCHSGSGPGRDLGGLTLDGSSNLIHRELTEEAAFTSATEQRINLTTPEASLVLTMPSAEDPADPHPNITFSGPLDPDYLTILVWIREGALQN